MHRSRDVEGATRLSVLGCPGRWYPAARLSLDVSVLAGLNPRGSGAQPLTSPSTISTRGGKNFPGWPCDPVVEAMRADYVHESDPAKRQALLESMHRRLWETIPYVPLGQFKQPFLWRKNVTGVLRANNVVYWNIDKT